MSKQIKARITCPECGSGFEAALYRSLWIEDPKNIRLIYSDTLNLVVCPSCGNSSRLEFPVLCTNAKKGVAIWYEPYHDSAVDKDIQQYAAHFGPNSFYAQAPRIRSWEDFKKKVEELEGTPASREPSMDRSSQMHAGLRGFIDRIAKDSSPSSYPQWLGHLRSPTSRIWYALLPFACLLLFLIVAEGASNALADMSRHIGEVLGVGLLITSISYAVLSVVHLALLHAKPWEQRGMPFRLWIFGSGCWVVGAFLIILLFDPYNIGSWSYMSADEWVHMFMVLLAPPAFLGSATYIYLNFVSRKAAD